MLKIWAGEKTLSLDINPGQLESRNFLKLELLR